MKVVLDLITVKFLQSFSTKPLQFFGPIAFERRVRISHLSLPEPGETILSKDIGTALLLLGALLIIVGIQFIGWVSWRDDGTRVSRNTEKPIYVIKKVIGPVTK